VPPPGRHKEGAVVRVQCIAGNLCTIEWQQCLDGGPGPGGVAVVWWRVTQVLREGLQEQEELATDRGEEGNDVIGTAGRPGTDGQTQRVDVLGRNGGTSFFGLHGKDLGAVGDEVPRSHVRGFNVGDWRLCEALRRQVTASIGAEGINIQLVDAVASQSSSNRY
jgi:hypothetical protein